MKLCRWCRDSIRTIEYRGYCSSHCKAQHSAAVSRAKDESPYEWDGHTRYATERFEAPVIYERYCLLCGRGQGRQGELLEVPNCPRGKLPCAFCIGGVLLVREVTTAERERALRRIFSEAA